MKYLNSNNNKGFTLVELLVSMIIIMLIGTMILVVFFTALRGAQKSQKIMTLRQNGSFALSQLTKSLRESEEIISYPACVAGPQRSITVASSKDHGVTTFLCTDDKRNIASDSANDGTNDALLLNTTGDFVVTSCTFTCGEKNNERFITISFELAPSTIPTPGVNDITTFASTIFLPNVLSR